MNKDIALKVGQEIKDYNPFEKKEVVDSEKKYNEGILVNKDGEIQTDKHGVPIFKDYIEVRTNSSDLLTLWESCKALLEENLKGMILLQSDADGVAGLMELIGDKYRDGSKSSYVVAFPVNYLVGSLHVLNMCRMFSIGETKELDRIALEFSRVLDAYRSIKDKEKMAESSPSTLIGKEANPVYFLNKFDEVKSLE